ncbi:hypothetical protein [Rhodococcus sp. NPDC057529]|uniref:hypothetical protein n=1 Tax=Rhodococcus sp. NPDC057529 TaxID=3346158 RepID=UPI00366D1320
MRINPAFAEVRRSDDRSQPRPTSTPWRGRVVDLVDPGETVGQISVLSGLPPPLAIRASEDTLCYRFLVPRPVLRHPPRDQFGHCSALVTGKRLARSGLVDQARPARPRP